MIGKVIDVLGNFFSENSRTLNIPVYPEILQSLERNKFVLFQYQTGFLVFMHEDNLKL